MRCLWERKVHCSLGCFCKDQRTTCRSNHLRVFLSQQTVGLYGRWYVLFFPQIISINLCLELDPSCLQHILVEQVMGIVSSLGKGVWMKLLSVTSKPHSVSLPTHTMMNVCDVAPQARQTDQWGWAHIKCVCIEISVSAADQQGSDSDLDSRLWKETSETKLRRYF